MMGNTQYLLGTVLKPMMLKPIITALYFSTALSIHDTANHQLFKASMPLPMDGIYYFIPHIYGFHPLFSRLSGSICTRRES